MNTGVGCYFLLQAIFPTQRSIPNLWSLLHWQAGSLQRAPPWLEVKANFGFSVLDLVWPYTYLIKCCVLYRKILGGQIFEEDCMGDGLSDEYGWLFALVKSIIMKCTNSRRNWVGYLAQISTWALQRMSWSVGDYWTKGQMRTLGGTKQEALYILCNKVLCS